MSKLDDSVLSIDNDDNNDESYTGFCDYLNNDTNRKKNSIISNINMMGDEYLKEIDRKKRIENKQKEKYVNYILKHSDNYDRDGLFGYTLPDIINIHTEIRENKISTTKKLFNFLFNI